LLTPFGIAVLGRKLSPLEYRSGEIMRALGKSQKLGCNRIDALSALGRIGELVRVGSGFKTGATASV
jgi:hypothetical protein